MRNKKISLLKIVDLMWGELKENAGNLEDSVLRLPAPLSKVCAMHGAGYRLQLSM